MRDGELNCESRPYLIEEVFKHKVVVVITGGELHILVGECKVNVTVNS